MIRAGDEKLRVSVRLRPPTQEEADSCPAPWLVQAGKGEVRIYAQRPLRTGAPLSPRAALPPRLASPGHVPKHPQQGSHRPTRSLEGQQALQQLCGDHQAYAFPAVIGPQASDDEVYRFGCREVVESACSGWNGTVLTYGQAGSGKTYTHEAVTRAAVATIFEQAVESTGRELAAVGVSVAEISGDDHIRCLLGGGDVTLRQGQRGDGIVLEGAREQPCYSEDEALAAIAGARARRAVGERRGNAGSSRSHLVVRIRLEVLELAGGAHPEGGSSARGVAFGSLTLVDLAAGTERMERRAHADSRAAQREALNINKSLLCLGNVVNALVERAEGRKVHVPYRDSKLTRLLEDALGGSGRCALIACICPLPGPHIEQTRATLEFATLAARVVCKPQCNMVALEAPSESMQRVLAMTSELERLRQALAAQSAECEALRMQLAHGVVQAGPLEKLATRISAKLGGGDPSRRTSADGAAGGAATAAAAATTAGQPRCSSAMSHRGREADTHSPLMWQLLQAEAQADAAAGGGGSRAASPDGLLDAWLSFAGQQGRVWRHLTLAADLDTIGEGGALGPPSAAGTAAPLSARQVHVRPAESDGGLQLGGGTRAPAVQVLQAASLREHIISTVVRLLQHKKAEARALKEHAGRLGAQLAGAKAQQDEQEARLGGMMDGILRLGEARREEFARWSGHLQGLEEGLLEAQREALAYRDEAVALQAQLDESEARCQRQAEQLAALGQSALQAGQACSDSKLQEAVAVLSEALRQRECQLGAGSEAIASLQCELAAEKARVAGLEEKTRAAAEAGAAAFPGSRNSMQKAMEGVDVTVSLQDLHFKILETWAALAVPHSTRTAVVLHPAWQQRSHCAAHLALLGRMRELYAADPAHGVRAQELLHEEGALIAAGLEALSQRELAAACSTFGISGYEADALQERLMRCLWTAANPAVAGAIATASSAVCWAALKRNPSELLCSCNLTGTGHVVAALGAAVSGFMLST